MHIISVLIYMCIIVVCNGNDMCSGIQFPNEKPFPLDALEGTWYQHFNEDNTPFAPHIPTDAKFIFYRAGRSSIKYFTGRSQTGDGCATLVFLDRQREPTSACTLVQLIAPELGQAFEFIYSLLPGGDQLLFTFCVNPPECSERVASAITRRERLCRGERELFVNKFKDLGVRVRYNKILRPASNNCTVPGTESIEELANVRSCSQLNL